MRSRCARRRKRGAHNVGHISGVSRAHPAAQEARVPLVHWVVLASTGSSLLLGFTLVSLGVRSPYAVISRLLFSALIGALLTVSRLLIDLATPFDAGSSYSAAGEVRRLPNACATRADASCACAHGTHADRARRRRARRSPPRADASWPRSRDPARCSARLCAGCRRMRCQRMTRSPRRMIRYYYTADRIHIDSQHQSVPGMIIIMYSIRYNGIQRQAPLYSVASVALVVSLSEAVSCRGISTSSITKRIRCHAG